MDKRERDAAMWNARKEIVTAVKGTCHRKADWASLTAEQLRAIRDRYEVDSMHGMVIKQRLKSLEDRIRQPLIEHVGHYEETVDFCVRCRDDTVHSWGDMLTYHCTTCGLSEEGAEF